VNSQGNSAKLCISGVQAFLPRQHKSTNGQRHTTLGSPIVSCLTTAHDKGFLPNISGLTKATLRKCPPHTVATAERHLDQTRKNKHSTKTTHPSPFLQLDTGPGIDPLTDAFPPAEPTGQATQAVCINLWDSAKGKVFSNLTGRLPVPSRQGNNCMFLLHGCNSNSINVRATPSRNAHHILAAHKDIFDMLVL
jgi:hypothetical protein